MRLFSFFRRSAKLMAQAKAESAWETISPEELRRAHSDALFNDLEPGTYNYARYMKFRVGNRPGNPWATVT